MYACTYTINHIPSSPSPHTPMSSSNNRTRLNNTKPSLHPTQPPTYTSQSHHPTPASTHEPPFPPPLHTHRRAAATREADSISNARWRRNIFCDTSKICAGVSQARSAAAH